MTDYGLYCGGHGFNHFYQKIEQRCLSLLIILGIIILHGLIGGTERGFWCV